MESLKKGRGAKGLALLLAAGLCLGVAGCAVAPFGNELTENAAAQSTGAPMPIEATYVQTVPASAVAPAPAVTASVPPASLPPPVAASPPASSGDALLSPEEKERVIAELEALAKKQGAELNAERAKAQAACDNLSADELRKKMLQGEC
ncbi:MAG TPA: hypothetical protein VG894_07430 [Bauldia sp.]|nr:hypothetical protein [Bauldia sp.]